ncbi:MAG: hypothetical protein PUD42_03260 [Clostridiales bacterium]|nr:hypothetical protein [Clostridiales bacterium]MDY2729871.1 hypothetical protein [Clostridium sp.]
MNKTIKRVICIATMGMILSTTGYNIVNASSIFSKSNVTLQEDNKISNLKVSVNDDLNYDSNIKVNVGAKIKFTVDNKWDNYKIYVNDNLLEESSDTNVFYWNPEEEGAYKVKLVGENSNDDTFEEKDIYFEALEKDYRAPKIRNIDIFSKANFDLECVANTSGDNVKYKFQVREFQVAKDGDNEITPLYCYHNISDFIDNNNITWNQMRVLPEEGMVVGYSIKVIAENEYGYDSKEYNFSAEPANNKKIQDLKTSINEEIVDSNNLQFNTNSSLEFKGERGYIYYELYVNDKLIDMEYRSNYLNWKPDKAGDYNVKVVGYNSNGEPEGAARAEKNMHITISDKDEKAPKIKKVSLNSTDENSVRNINCAIEAYGENNEYKIEALSLEKSNAPSGYWADEFTPYKLVRDFSKESTLSWSEESNIINKDDERYIEFEYIKKLKITVKNEYGYDSVIFNYNDDSGFEYQEDDNKPETTPKDDEDKSTSTPKGDEDKSTSTPKGDEDKSTSTPKDDEDKSTSTPKGDEDKSTSTPKEDEDKSTSTPKDNEEIIIPDDNDKTDNEKDNNLDQDNKSEETEGKDNETVDSDKDSKEDKSHTSDGSNLAKIIGFAILGLSQSLILKKKSEK